MPAMTTRQCAQCNQPFTARTADVSRGWARYCSKSCKAKEQERRTGQWQEIQDRAADGADCSGTVTTRRKPQPQPIGPTSP